MFISKMKLLFILLIILVLISILYKSEGFTTYSLNYETTIEPKRFPNIAAGQDPSTDYRRCVCSSDGKCRCIYDSQLDFTSDFPELYFDEYPLYY
jgi:hypothetical protein